MGLEQHLEKLVYLAKVAEVGNISAAARELKMSQPALSRAIAIVEKEIGTALFQRGKSGVTLTDAGNSLWKVAKSILTEIRFVEQTIQLSDVAVQMRPLRLGTKEPFSIHVWPSFSSWCKGLGDPMLNTAIERMVLSIDKLNSRLWNELTKGEVDLVLMAEPPSSNDVVTTLLFHSSMRLYRAGFKARQRFGSAARSSHVPFICYREAIIKRDQNLGQVLASAKICHQTLNVQSFDAAREMAIRGLGLAFLPHWIAMSDVIDGRLEEVQLSSLERSLRFPLSGVYFCTTKAVADIEVVRELKRRLKQFCTEVFKHTGN